MDTSFFIPDNVKIYKINSYMGKYMKRIKKYLIMLSLIAVTIFLRHSCTVQAAQEDDIFKELYM